MNKKILIADEHYVVRIGTAKVLEKKFTKIVVDHADSYEEIKRKLQINKFDLIIMDVKMTRSIFKLVFKELKAIQKDIKIMVFSTYEENIAIEYIRKGAKGYLNKSSDEETLINAIQSIFEDGYYYPSSIIKMLSDRQHENNTEIILSKREFQVFELLVKGKVNSEIASILDIRSTTASTYRRRIYAKFDVYSLIDLIKIYNRKYLN